jgi:hypothetical protein
VLAVGSSKVYVEAFYTCKVALIVWISSLSERHRTYYQLSFPTLLLKIRSGKNPGRYRFVLMIGGCRSARDVEYHHVIKHEQRKRLLVTNDYWDLQSPNR